MEPTRLFLKPDKGFLMSPDGAGDGGVTPRPRPALTPGAVVPTSLCSSPAPAMPPGKPVFNLSSIGIQNCETRSPNCDPRPWPRHTETPDPRL